MCVTEVQSSGLGSIWLSSSSWAYGGNLTAVWQGHVTPIQMQAEWQLADICSDLDRFPCISNPLVYIYLTAL